MGHARRLPSQIHEARCRAISCQGRRALRGVGYEPEAAGVRLARQGRHCIQQGRCFSPRGALRAGSAAEHWDAKGLASLPWNYDNAATAIARQRATPPKNDFAVHDFVKPPRRSSCPDVLEPRIPRMNTNNTSKQNFRRSRFPFVKIRAIRG
jgi:hypothetical protein